MNDTTPRDMADVRRLMPAALIAGGAALLVAVLVGLWQPRALLLGYLAAFVLWLGVPLGAAAILMTFHLVGGRWGWSLRGVVEPVVWTLPLFALAFVPVAVGMESLYRWAVASEVAHSDLLEHKAAYLNEPAFLVRAVLYFGLWIGGGLVLTTWSRRAARPGAGGLSPLSAVGLIVYVLSMSFAAIDWVASLEPTWYSSIFGLYLLVGQLLMAMGLMVLTLVWLSRRGDGRYALEADVLHDLGNLLLMLVVLHAYLGFSQFFIIWNGNLPHEVVWYVPRVRGTWGAVWVAIILGHFALPFVALLFRHVKRNVRTLVAVVVLVLVARLADVAWTVLPSAEAHAGLAALVAALAAIGLGGLWLGLFAWRFGTWPAPEAQREASDG